MQLVQGRDWEKVEYGVEKVAKKQRMVRSRS